MHLCVVTRVTRSCFSTDSLCDDKITKTGTFLYFVSQIGIMFRKKNSRKNGKPRRRYGRRFSSVLGSSSRIPTLVSSRAPCPPRALVKMRYNTPITLDVGVTGIAAIHAFSCNGCYDPDATGTGHQPMGFDQWSSFYQRYQVLRSKITVTFFATADPLQRSIVGIRTNAQTTLAYSTAATICETGDVAYAPLTFATGGNNVARVTKHFDARQQFGARGIIGEDALSALITANPSEQYYFIVFAAPASPGDDTPEIDCQVQIEYEVLFSSPREMSSS